jgi:plastocyanin
MKKAMVFMAVLCLTAQSLWATTHVVQFGGSFGFTYSPSSFSAKVGDTVKWEGAFSTHPLSSTSVPATAQSFSASSGTSFSYVIMVAGTYNYHCDIHFSLGMTGSFTATQSSVRYIALPQGAGRSNELHLGISEAKGLPFIRLTVPQSGRATLKLYDLSGRELATILDNTVRTGDYTIPVGSSILGSGNYFVRLSFNGAHRVVSFFTAN